MKRIANKVAVQTICYTISGLQKIRIVDFKSEYDCSRKANGETVFEGVLNKGYNYKFAKYFESECHGIDIDGDTLVFSIVTAFEEYK